MQKKKLRFTAGVVVIVGAIVYFAISGFQEGKAYYRTLDEIQTMGTSPSQRVRVGGVVKSGSIERHGNELHFALEQDAITLPVVYKGTAPVPDTFKGGVEAVVEGHVTSQGTFTADHIQAKCASKYEAKYGNKSGSANTM